MKKMLLTISACLLVAGLALGDAGYGRGPESDPVATPILSTATGNIATLQGQMITVTGDVATLQGQMTTTTGDVATLQGQMTTATGDVATLQGQMTTATGDVATLQGQMTTVTGDVATLQGQMTTATGDVATLQGQMTTTTGDVATLQGQMTTVTGDVATLQGQMITATGDVATLQSSVWAAPGLTPATNGLENAVTIQAKSLDGENLAGYRVLHVWTSETDLGAASTNNIVTIVLSTGTAVATVEANADYWYCTASDGSALATVTATAAGTNYIMCADGSTVSSAEIVFTE